MCGHEGRGVYAKVIRLDRNVIKFDAVATNRGQTLFPNCSEDLGYKITYIRADCIVPGEPQNGRINVN